MSDSLAFVAIYTAHTHELIMKLGYVKRRLCKASIDHFCCSRACCELNLLVLMSWESARYRGRAHRGRKYLVECMSIREPFWGQGDFLSADQVGQKMLV